MENILSLLSTLSISSSLTAELNAAVLLEPYTYMVSSLENGIQRQLIRVFNHWLKVPSAQLDAIVHVIELLHVRGLLIDDIEDDSEVRRGKPVAHKMFGVPQTVNSANYMYTFAFLEVLKITSVIESKNPSKSSLSCAQIFSAEMLALHRDQSNELSWRRHFHCPTEEEYIQMVKGKVGSLLRIAVKFMVECCTVNLSSDTDYVSLANLLAIWLQIRDDYMILHSDKYSESEGVGFVESLSDGKFSFPIVHGIMAKPESKCIQNVLLQRPKDSALKHYIASFLMEVTHSFEYTRNVLSSLEAQVHAEVMRLGGNPDIEAILSDLAL